MEHKKLAEELKLRAKHLSLELLISQFQVKTIIDEEEVSYLSIPREDVEPRVEGYVYEGFKVSITVEDHKLTIVVEDV